jgi:hypothetical protein
MSSSGARHSMSIISPLIRSDSQLFAAALGANSPFDGTLCQFSRSMPHSSQD